MTYFNKPFNTEEQPIEKDRYRLLWAALCPYAHRAVIARKLLGLDKVISLGTLDYRRGEDGWQFSLDPDGVDPILKKTTIKSVYNYSEPNYEGPYSVPALVDLKTEKIVRRESAEILHEFATVFKSLHKEGAIDLYPESLAKQIDEWNEKLAIAVNDGVYGMGFAKTQDEYNLAFNRFFDTLDEVEERLSNQRYINGNSITETDIRFYTTMIRFDVVYYGMYGANKKRIEDYSNIFNYLKDLYQTPGFGDTTNFEAIKAGYYLSGGREIVPGRPSVDKWQEPHDRLRF